MQCYSCSAGVEFACIVNNFPSRHLSHGSVSKMEMVGFFIFRTFLDFYEMYRNVAQLKGKLNIISN